MQHKEQAPTKAVSILAEARYVETPITRTVLDRAEDLAIELSHLLQEIGITWADIETANQAVKNTGLSSSFERSLTWAIQQRRDATNGTM